MTGAIVQARMTSSRLPGKVLRELPFGGGVTVLEQVIRRLKKAQSLERIIIATTVNPQDDCIVEAARKEGVFFTRGPEKDVLSRYYQAARENGLDTVVRITSDCPCIDPEVVDMVVRELAGSGADYATDAAKKTWPHGLDAEAFSMGALERSFREAKNDFEREHVTPYIYMTGRFSMVNVEAPADSFGPDIRITLDTPEDYALLSAVYDYLYTENPFFGAREIVALFREKPWLKLINGKVVQKKIFSLQDLEEELREAASFLDLQDLKRAADFIRGHSASSREKEIKKETKTKNKKIKTGDHEMGEFRIGDRLIGRGRPAFIIAEMSANHNQSFEDAASIVRAAKEAGADAIKLQTYTADTITIDSKREYFRITGGLWDGEYLHGLYKKAYTPWEWQPRLKELAEGLGMVFFSTPFDKTAVDFLHALDVPAYKVASFELNDIPLIEYIASKGRPMIMSTGLATLGEIEEAVNAARKAGAPAVALLKCTSAYPAPPEDVNLRTIPHLAEAFGVAAGLSDHTMGIAVPVAAVSLGACIIEKHFTLSRARGGPDAAFSLEPAQLKAMVEAVRTAEKAAGRVHYGATAGEGEGRAFRRSLFVVKDVKAGELFTEDNIRSIRPGQGLAPKHIKKVLGKKASADLQKGTPLAWDMLG